MLQEINYMGLCWTFDVDIDPASRAHYQYQIKPQH